MNYQSVLYAVSVNVNPLDVAAATGLTYVSEFNGDWFAGGEMLFSASQLAAKGMVLVEYRRTLAE